MKASILITALLLCPRAIFAQSSASASSTASSLPSSSSAASNVSLGPIINVNDTISSPFNATVWTLIYTYPIYIFANFAGSVLRTVSVNQFFHQRGLASPDSPGVIKPNVDTLYSRVVLDLSQSDVVLTIPNITNNLYWNYPVLDLFGNVIAEIGVVNGNTAGKYLIRRAEDVFVPAGYQSGNASTPYNSSYAGIVNLPTTYGTMLIRFLLSANTTADLTQILTYQNSSVLTNVTRQSGTKSPSLISLAPNGTYSGIDTPAKLLNLSAQMVSFNQPENYTDRYRTATYLALAGLYNGQYYPQSGVNLTYASLIANNSITADINNASHIRQQGNNWELSIPSFQGNYGTNYGARAYIAIAGYQAQTVKQTLYPGHGNIGFSSIATLQPNTSLLVTFSGKPRLNKNGFWSFTVYGADQYLVPNPLNRYEIGDRSYNLTYISGGTVYGPNANSSADGPFQILVQNVNCIPPANWTGNWIPATDTFSYIVRWYVPQDAMTNGSYVYPVEQIVPTIQ